MANFAKCSHVFKRSYPSGTFSFTSLRAKLVAQRPSISKYVLRMCSNAIEEKNNRKKIVFLGTPDCAAASLDILMKESCRSSSFKISAVVSQPPAPAGRKQKLTKSPVHILAENNSIPVYFPEKAKNETFLQCLKEIQPDLCITAAYGNFLPQEFLNIPKFGTLNIHPSLLPKYRGASPVQRCLENGDTITGVTVLFTILKMDAGPIVCQTSHNLEGYEKAADLLMTLFTLGTNKLIESLPSIFDGSIVTKTQDENLATKALKLNVSESLIDFSVSNASVVHNKVRAFSVWPGTWSMFKLGSESSAPQRVKIISTVVLEPKHSVMDHDRDKLVNIVKSGKVDLLRIVCGDGSVLGISEVQLEGKKVMSVKDLVNGLRGSKYIEWVIP